MDYEQLWQDEQRRWNEEHAKVRELEVQVAVLKAQIEKDYQVRIKAMTEQLLKYGHTPTAIPDGAQE